MKATGTFNIKRQPLESFAKGTEGINMNRMSIEKTFSGDLTGTSRGEMLAAMTSVQGSAGYVAIEQVLGELSSKKGSFVLQHFGIMADGSERLILEVIPDSGTGDLTGITGSMVINHDDGQHTYEFDYSLPS